MNMTINKLHFIYSAISMAVILNSFSCKANKELPEPEETKDKYTTISDRGYVLYSDFNAKGDGKTDDIDAIAEAHTYANQHKYPVKADQGVTYFISGKSRTAEIRTDTDFGTALFVIDDTNVQNRNSPVFTVSSNLETFKPSGVTNLKINQTKVAATWPGPCLVTAVNSNVKRYIRYGVNQNSGSSQTDVFLVDANGNVDMNAPIIWDFDQITDLKALPIDETTLTIKGGRFTTIANKETLNNSYYNRGIASRRSNVVVDGVEHRVTGEGELGAPYTGFLNISDCAFVTVRNTILTGHKTSITIDSAGEKVSRGTYDISVTRAVNISFVNCSQANDIMDTKFWGIMGTNYCKNLSLDRCTFSRFDAHMGVANATIRNSTLGYQGINAIGSGVLTVENSTINGKTLINLRSDYGSTWHGEFIIRNCVFVPGGGSSLIASLIGGSNRGQHDFGYTCYMPERITFENLRIDDSNHPASYNGPAIFANFNSAMKDDSYVELFPYIITREVILRNVTTTSEKTLRVSENPFMFRNVKVTVE